MIYGIVLALRTALIFSGLPFNTGGDIDDMLDILQDEVPPEISEEEQLQHIRTNFQALIMMLVLIAAIALTIYLLNKRAGKKRYAAHQAQLAAEGKLDRGNALSEIANSGAKPKFINDDDAAAPDGGRTIGQVFGENYNPYGKDASGALGE
jgi:hypothetical protein